MKKTSLLLLLLAANPLFAQTDLTIEQATLGQGAEFAIQQINQPKWKDDQSLSELTKYRDTLVVRTKDNKWEQEFLLSALDLQHIVNAHYKNAIFSFKTIPSDLKWIDTHTIRFTATDSQKKFEYYIVVNLQTKKVEKSFHFNPIAQELTLSRNADYLAWLKDNNIVITTDAGSDIVVTDDTILDIVNGSSDTHRNEFGIDKGMWWSPKQDQLLYYRKDQTTVADYPITQWVDEIAYNKNIKYPMAGQTNERVTLVIYDVLTKEKITLQTGYEDQFLTSVTWDPSGNHVYVGVLNREQNHLKINQYNAATGQLEHTLFEQKAKTYVEPSQGLEFLKEDPKKFIYFSDIDGYRHMYLYNVQGKLEANLGAPNIAVTNYLGLDKDQKNIYYIGATHDGLDRQLFRVNLKKGKTEQISEREGTHRIVFNASKTFYLDQFTDLNTPNDVSIVQVSNNKATEILAAKNPYLGVIDLPKTELIQFKASDNKTDLNARIIYPTNFDASKKYPVLLYVYAGPHAQLITNSYLGGANLFLNYMAQQGYVVYTVDSRGSANRGREFEHVIHRNLGVNEVKDQVKGLEHLNTLGFIDMDRIGVYGWSYGGFMTTNLLLSHPEIFKVGVAGGPVMDWKYYEIMYGERYMDTPFENPQGYQQSSMIQRADQLKGKLLLIHGSQDPVVVQQHSMNFIQASIVANKQVDYFLYPTHLHNVSGKDRIHLNQKIAQYFFDFLPSNR